MEIFWLLTYIVGSIVFLFGWYTLGDDLDPYFKKKYRAENKFRKYVHERYAFAIYAPWLYFEEDKLSEGWWIMVAFDICFALGMAFAFMALSVIGILP